MTKVILLTDNHTHEKRKCEKGEILDLTEEQAEFLIKQNAAEKADETTNKE